MTAPSGKDDAVAFGQCGIDLTSDSLLSRMTKLFANPRHSDFIIKCCEREWAVHRSIIGLSSTYFERACSGDFEEGANGMITLKEDLPNAVHAMLSFIYTADYDDEAFKEEEGYEAVTFNVHVHTIADKYNMPTLCQLATSKFRLRAESTWQSPDFAVAITAIYDASSSEKSMLKSHAIDTCHTNAKALFSQAEAEKGTGVMQVARDVPCFGADLLLRSQGPSIPLLGEKRYYCPQGQREFVIQKLAIVGDYNCPYCSARGPWDGWVIHRLVTDK